MLPQIVTHLAHSRVERFHPWARDKAEVLRLRKKVRGIMVNREMSSQAGINLLKPRVMSSQAGTTHGDKDHRDQRPNTVTDHRQVGKDNDPIQEEMVKDNDPIQEETVKDNIQELLIKDRVMATPRIARSRGHWKAAPPKK